MERFTHPLKISFRSDTIEYAKVVVLDNYHYRTLYRLSELSFSFTSASAFINLF